MNWINETQKAINYIEDNLMTNINIDDISDYVYSSKDYFQKMFSIVTGFSVNEYIRNRRLSLAGQELASLKDKVIDIALKYGYETPESFSKAFARFHGITPLEARANKDRLKCFSPLSIQIDVKGGFIMSRKLISNVEKIYDNGAENYSFCSCMRSVMSALNENEAFDFIFFAGVTGDLFMQIWYEPKWCYNNEYSLACRDSQVPIKAAFDACGYEFEYVYKEDVQQNKPTYIRKIVDSIDKGLPVLTFGIVGPPTCSIICGYDENGEVLIGWAQFTDELKEDNPLDFIVSENYFSKRNGLDNSNGLIFFKKKKHIPPVNESVKKSILNIANLSSLKTSKNIYFGKSAFEMWADSLLGVDSFKDESLLPYPLDTYGSCMVMIGSNMHGKKEYLRRTLELCPDMEKKIISLQKAYEKESEVIQKILDLQGGYFFDADRKALLNKDFRTHLAELIRQVGQCYDEAANVIRCSL